jgi:hypothetical protein
MMRINGSLFRLCAGKTESGGNHGKEATVSCENTNPWVFSRSDFSKEVRNTGFYTKSPFNSCNYFLDFLP